MYSRWTLPCRPKTNHQQARNVLLLGLRHLSNHPERASKRHSTFRQAPKLEQYGHPPARATSLVRLRHIEPKSRTRDSSLRSGRRLSDRARCTWFGESAHSPESMASEKSPGCGGKISLVLRLMPPHWASSTSDRAGPD